MGHRQQSLHRASADVNESSRASNLALCPNKVGSLGARTVVRRHLLGKAAVLMSSRVDARDPTTSHSFVGDNVKLAVASILASNLVFSLGDATVKSISANFVLWQIFVTRSIIAIPLLIAVNFLRLGSSSLAPRQLGWVELRSVMLTLSFVAYFSFLTSF